MNAGNSDSDSDQRLPKVVATGIVAVAVSLVGASILAVGSIISGNRVDIAKLNERCQRSADQLFELHAELAKYPSADDLAECRATLELLKDWKSKDEHRMPTIEKKVEDLQTRTESRADPFTGTEGKRLEWRVEQLEKKLNLQ